MYTGKHIDCDISENKYAGFVNASCLPFVVISNRIETHLWVFNITVDGMMNLGSNKAK